MMAHHMRGQPGTLLTIEVALPMGRNARKSVGELRRTFSLHYRGVGSIGFLLFFCYIRRLYYLARLDGNLPFFCVCS